MAATQLYQAQHYSAALVQLIKAFRSRTQDGTVTSTSQQQHFLTNQRPQSSETWEVLNVNFKSPVSISRVSFKIFEISSEYELYYRNRDQVLLPLLDRSLYHFKGSISSGQIEQWYPIDRRVRPVVATSLEVRIRRTLDTFLGDRYTSLGIRDLLIKREVYDAEDAMSPLEKTVDSMGNLVSHSIVDWEPSKAVDGDSYSFWKSEPQPDPDAVVSYYMDTRSSATSAIVGRTNFFPNPIFKNGTANFASSNAPVWKGVWENGLYSRQNLCPNPNFATNTAGWSTASGGTIIRDTDSTLKFVGAIPVVNAVYGQNFYMNPATVSIRAGELCHIRFDIKATNGDEWKVWPIANSSLINNIDGTERFVRFTANNDNWRTVDIVWRAQVDYTTLYFLVGTEQTASTSQTCNIKNVVVEYGYASTYDGPGTQTVKTYGTTYQRVNYCPNPGGDSLSGYGQLQGATVALESGDDRRGSYGNASCIRVTCNGSATNQGLYRAVGTQTSLQIGDWFTVSAWVKAPEGSRMLITATSSAVGIESNYDPYPGSNMLYIGTGNWERISTKAQVNATCSPLLYIRNNEASAVTFYVDDILIEKGGLVGDFFYGGMPSADVPDGHVVAWNGTVNNSVSELTTSIPERWHKISRLGVTASAKYVGYNNTAVMPGITRLAPTRMIATVLTYDEGIVASLGLRPRDSSTNTYTDAITVGDSYPLTPGVPRQIELNMTIPDIGNTDSVVGYVFHRMADGSDAPTGATAYIRAVMVEQNSTGEFFSGDSTDSIEWDYQWSGTDGNSPSVAYYTDQGAAQRIDRLWIDPVYSGQQINLYYSTDDSVGPRALSTKRLHPITSTNAEWSQEGLTLDQSTSEYAIDGSKLSYETGESWWMGMVCVANFASTDSLPSDLSIVNAGTSFTLEFSSVMDNRFVFNVGGKQVVSESMAFNSGFRYIVVCGFSKDTAKNFLRIYTVSGLLLSESETDNTISPLWNQIALQNSEGVIRQWFIKRGEVRQAEEDYFVSNPSDIIAVDSNMRPNMLYGADFTSSETGFGGTDDSFFSAKQWSPIWRDWTVERGFYFFPAPVYAKYLKLEFTRLTEEPYPVWESGIDVKYQTFPVSVSKSITDTTVTKEKEVVQTSTTWSSTKGVTAYSANRAVTYQYEYSQSPQDVTVSVGTGVIDSIPHLYDKPLSTTLLTERASSSVFSSASSTQTIQQAQDAIYTVVSGDWLIKIAARYNIPWRDIYNANKSMIDSDPRVRRLPRRSEGWWIFPGQQLRIPAAIMETITQSYTRTERLTVNKTSTTAVQRFGTTSLHLYETKTARRDAAMAYFAGIREVIPFRVNYISAADVESYDFKQMDDVDFTISSTLERSEYGALVGIGSIESNVWHSTSLFRRLDLSIAGRNAYQRVFHDLNPYGVGSFSQATWDSPVKWDDPVVPWGPPTSLVEFTYGSNIFYEGRSAVRLSRQPGSGESGLDTVPLSVIPNARYRFVSHAFFPTQTTNSIKMQFVDEDNQILVESDVYPKVGTWDRIESPFLIAYNNLNDVRVRLVVSGDDPQEIYVASLGIELVTTVPFVSNNGGTTYYDATESVYRQNGYFVFPTSNNQLRLKFVSYDPEDAIFGFTASPLYLETSDKEAF